MTTTDIRESGTPPRQHTGGWLEGKARGAVRRLRRSAVRQGAPARWFGWRHVEPVPLEEIATDFQTVHPPKRARNPLPVNITDRKDLPTERHWWGYSMQDVPDRHSEATVIATVRDATVTSYRNEVGEFYPAILSGDGRAINLREIKFRPGHAEKLRDARAAGLSPARMDRAVWILERVHENHSHWLTAHLPKLLLARDQGLIDQVLLPARLKPTQQASLDRLGIETAQLDRLDETRPLKVAELTLISTDRFRPELLRPVRDVMAPALPSGERNRRIYISRARARFRRLLNEDEVWPLLAQRGFERVFMEDLDFDAQVELMRRTDVLVAPHGAGLTNMMFCAEGTRVVEIASLGFPNPNFYAVAAAMGHAYYIVAADEHGDVRPLERNLEVEPERLRKVLDMIGTRAGEA